MSTVSRKAAAIATSAVLSLAVSATAGAQPAVSAPASGDNQPRTSSTATLWLPDGKRTAVVWKTWYRNANGKYHGHYGFSSASRGVSVYAVLWTSSMTRYLPAEGKRYSYSNESTVQLFACDNDYPNGEDCTATW
ncbi:hypothetical protein CU254_40975 (plasmid) [Amycolatopsis sp. AA4]|uniref:hypothetical protein n=1 Tax=Actinomycetes TaxID=1760 RepID=UPI0001B56187|nr:MULTISPECIES: hypothetical protein [Actinomycetes]ATY16968.1 hypothetical protein CU254_40975 [Amycolatopsis sp. AA4]EFL12544.1 predicted protein [Streptomyces sp. AA4]